MFCSVYLLLCVAGGAASETFWIYPTHLFELPGTFAQIHCYSNISAEFCPLTFFFEPYLWLLEPKPSPDRLQVTTMTEPRWWFPYHSQTAGSCHLTLHLKISLTTIGRYACRGFLNGSWREVSSLIASRDSFAFPPIPSWLLTASTIRKRNSFQRRSSFRLDHPAAQILHHNDVFPLRSKRSFSNLPFCIWSTKVSDGQPFQLCTMVNSDCNLVLGVFPPISSHQKKWICSNRSLDFVQHTLDLCGDKVPLRTCSWAAYILWTGNCGTYNFFNSPLTFQCNDSYVSSLPRYWEGLCTVYMQSPDKISKIGNQGIVPTPPSMMMTTPFQVLTSKKPIITPALPIVPPPRKPRAARKLSDDCSQCVVKVREGDQVKETLVYFSHHKCPGEMVPCKKGNVTYSYCKTTKTCYDPKHDPEQMWLHLKSQGKTLHQQRIWSLNTPVSIIIDVCEIVDCGHLTEQREYAVNDKYICPIKGSSGCGYGNLCPYWSCVHWATSLWGSTVPYVWDATLSKVVATANCKLRHCNKINFTIKGFNTMTDLYGNQFGIGIDGWGTDPTGIFTIEVQKFMEAEDQITHNFYTEFWKEMKKPIEIPDVARNLFIELAGTVAQALNVTNCYVCGGTNVGDQWPWEAAEWDISKKYNATRQPPHLNNSVWELRQALVCRWCVHRFEHSTPLIGDSLCEAMIKINISDSSVSFWPNASVNNVPFMWPLPNETAMYNWPTESGEMLNASYKGTWKAPPGLYWICGKRAYSHLPEKWTGSCTIGEIRPAFFLIPLGEGERLNYPVYDTHQRRKRSLNVEVPIYEDQEWKGKIWDAEEIIKVYGPATWAQDGTYGYRTPIYMINRIIRLQAVLELITRENALALNLIAKQHSQLRNGVFQNRLALDYLLAAEGGVCGKFNLSNCCLQIDDNGRVIEEITQKIVRLAHVPPQQWTGILDQGGFLGGIFNNWRQALFMIGIGFLGLMFLPCLIPLLHSVISSVVESAVQKQALHIWDFGENLGDSYIIPEKETLLYSEDEESF